MDNNSDALGQDLEGTVAPQTTNEPAPLVFDPTATIIIRDPEIFGDAIQLDANEVSNEYRASKNRFNEVVVQREQIRKLDAYLETAVAETADSEMLEMLKEIAEIFDITLTRTYSVTVTATHTFNVEVEIGGDEPDESDFTPEISSWLFNDLENLDSEITDFEANEE